MELLDSRRLTGANAVCDCAAAVIDVALDDGEFEQVVAAWQKQVRQLLDAVGWHEQRTFVRRCDGGASLAISAPIDALYAATDINDVAWEMLSGDATDFDAAVKTLRQAIDEESSPGLLQLEAAARSLGQVFLSDDDDVSIGLGTGSKTWSVAALPDPDDINWQELHGIPVGLVTGTNGKTTSVRLAAAVARAAGLHVGYSSTDCLVVDQTIVDHGDYAGPGGARTTLRHPQVEIAILETARGGLLRRGIGVPSASAALITRIARDHIGDFGSRNLEELLDAKWVVTRALGDDARLVLNADDPLLVARAAQSPVPVVWFSLDIDSPIIQKHIEQHGSAWAFDGESLCVSEQGAAWKKIVRADAIPLTLNGAALYNVGNALGVAALTACLGINHDAIVSGLCSLGPDDNPGRGNLFDINGVKVLVDFAHNPDAFRAIVDLAGRLPAKRKLIAFGEAGD
ncbi:MAG: Mur ligase [Gammaproteobacteria bacterium]|nr:Mur ligase [Gammaproteobacteria bacterium]